MNKLKLVAGVILIFLVGALTGALGTGIYFKNRMERFSAGGPPPRLRKVLVMKRLSKELDLTEQQRHAFEKIVEESEVKILALRRQYLPEIKAIMDRSFELMKDKLNSKQQKRLEELKERLENRHAKALINSVLTKKRPGQIILDLKERLNLTEEQATKVRPIVEMNIKRLREIVEEYRGQDRPKLPSLRREIREIQRSTEKGLADILTEEQMETYRKRQEEERFERRSERGRRKFDRETFRER